MSDQKESKYDRNLDKEIAKFSSKSGETKYVNVLLYQYNNGPTKARIFLRTKNTNPNADKTKQWITGKALSGLSKDDLKQIIINAEKALTKF